VVERSVLLSGLDVRFLDTAGERGDTDDVLEAEGIALGRQLTDEAELLLVTIPLHLPLSSDTQALLQRTAARPRLLVGTHHDHGVNVAGIAVDVALSNQSGEGVDALRDRIAGVLTQGCAGTEVLVLSQRQHDLFRSIGAHTAMAAEALVGMLGPAVAAEEVTAALERLAELSGEDVREAVLDRLFSRFCVGK
jgi:tRNA modification GTPase